MIKMIDKNKVRKDKHKRIRFKLKGTAAKPRLSVYRSTTQIYAQLIDDDKGITLASASSLDKDLAKKFAGKKKTEQATIVGEAIGKKGLKAGITTVVFDRSGYIYAGRVKNLAEGARAAGLKF